MSDSPVLTASARLDTDRPQRYLKQLVSHLGNRLETSSADEDHASVVMQNGSHCELVAATTGISMVATATDAEALASVEDVVGRHLLRFTGDEAMTTDWS